MGTHEINGMVKETHGIKCDWGVKGVKETHGMEWGLMATHGIEWG